MHCEKIWLGASHFLLVIRRVKYQEPVIGLFCDRAYFLFKDFKKWDAPDMASMRQRVDSSEGTILVAMREGFNSLRNYLDDLNYEVADNARATRLLKRRVARLERKDND